MPPTETTATAPSAARVRSIDLLRGLIMVLMAIDHVRVYSGLPAGGLTTGLFFTRWVTHFCAPGFVFFAGASAFLYGIKLNDKGKLAKYLLTRGLLLILLELTVIRFFWMFNFNCTDFTLAGIIWMLGWCMILLAAFVRLKPSVVGIIGLAIIAFQQVFHYVPHWLPAGWQTSFGHFWGFFYPSGLDGPPGIAVLFVIIPWIGVMMAGYGFGQFLIGDKARLKWICLRIGIAAIVVFFIAATLVIVLGPPYKGDMVFYQRLLAQSKYPPSQLFLLMTLGPLIALIPLAEKATGWLSGVFKTLGRVPLFYYLLHILLIHLLALSVNFIREGSIHQDRYTTAPFTEIEPTHQWPLPLLYLIFIIAEVILFVVCRWYANYKADHPQQMWLKYL